MAKSGGKSGDWLLIQELFERGDPAFVDALRSFDDAEVLGGFAQKWFADPRPEARLLMLDYLDRPLNAFRHEALVKRLFKLADTSGDDELMARFLVAFDRILRRATGKRSHFESQEADDQAAANAIASLWRDRGYDSVNVWQNWRKKFQVWGRWTEPTIVTPLNSVMPRGTLKETYDPYSWNARLGRYQTYSVPDWVFSLKLDSREFRKDPSLPESKRPSLLRYRLFTVATRHYLRRRAWRYFRKLGRCSPERYVPSVKQALVAYRDQDADRGLALIDNWGLIHILFGHSPVLTAQERGWRVAPGHTLAELAPAPRFRKLWDDAPRTVVELLSEAKSRPVRNWAVARIRQNPLPHLAVFPLEERLALLEHEDTVVVGLAAELIRDDPRLSELPVSRWVPLLRSASPSAIEMLCRLAEKFVTPSEVSLAEAVELASVRSPDLARLGFKWLQTKVPQNAEECLALLALTDAESEALRPEILTWTRKTLAESPSFQPDWVLNWLDSRQEDVRAEGWRWFEADASLREGITTWQRLLESPYDDIRLALTSALEDRTKKRGGNGASIRQGRLDPDLLRFLWASVLLNIQRGGQAKPKVIAQVLQRLEAHPEDLPQLIPLLAVALRSVRGPEFRQGLLAVVRLAERDEAARPLLAQAFPELKLDTPAPGPGVSHRRVRESR